LLQSLEGFLKAKHWVRALRIDGANRLKFGAAAPRYGERIWVNPYFCEHYIESADLRAFLRTRVRRLSGHVISAWPEALQQELGQNPKLNYCRARWLEGKSWADAGAVDFMMSKIAASPEGVSDNCRTREDVQQRFEALDDIWARVKREGHLPTRKELLPGNFREVGGIMMHIGPGGAPVFSGAGCHRFAMALILGKPFPAQLGIVHESALAHLPDFRSSTAGPSDS
jgi:hypothetical protein